MFNKYTPSLVILFSTGGALAASLTEKIAAKSEKITAVKQEIKTGKSINPDAGCRTKGCSRCNKCNKA